MNESYLYSVKNIAISLKPSRAICLLLMVLFVCLFGNIENANAAARTASVAGNWNNTATWGGSSVPGVGDNVIINSGITVTVTADAAANSVSVTGTGILTINNNITLTVYGNIDVANGAEFNAGLNNSDSATILVYGDFTNNGKADFWKSTVVIAGNLYTASTILQNNGDIVVGGNITGTVTGSGTGVVYPINSNATVSLTLGSSVTVNPLGTLPSDSTMLSYINQVIYGSSCSLSITDPVNVVTWSGCNAAFTATAPSGSTFQWQYNTGSGWVPLGTPTIGASTSTYSLTGITTSMNNYRYRAVITSGSCTKNGDFAYLYVTALTTPVVTTTQPTCSVSTGNISVTAPMGTGVTYSIDGTTYTNTTGNFSLVAPGTYNVTAKSPAGCISPVTSALIVSAPVKPTLSVVNQPTCSVATGSFSVTNYNAAYAYTVSPSTGVTVSGNTITAPAGSYTVTATLGSCSSVASSSVTVNAQPATPTVPGITTIQPTCGTTTGTITITAVTGETYSFDSGAYSSTLIYSGLAQGSSHTILAKNSSGCISAVANVTINTLSIKTWNGSWSPAGSPTSNDFVIINTNYSVSSNGDLNACSLTINSGSKLTIEAGKFVIIQNNLTVSGTLDVLDKGSLVMVNDSGVVTNSGTTTIHRFTTPFNKYDYTYWSTPVVSTTIASTFLEWNTGYSFEYLPANFLDANNDGLDDDGNDWSFVSTMTPGKGYIIMVPTPITGPSGNNPSEVVFSGKVNNGVQKITGVIEAGDYLIGNPYPSALDADIFLNYNSGVLDGTLNFWTHNTAIQLASNITNGTAGSGAYAFTSDDYASYNLVGGVGVGTGVGLVEKPNGKIASGQAFFATSNTTITGAKEIVFNNSMRLSSGGATLDNSQFFKTRSPKTITANAVEKHRIWLDLTNTQGAFKQTLVGYVTNATNDYDSRFDGESFDGNEFVDFYSINEDKNLVIQGRALPFDENDEVPLGFRTTINGTFTINIDQVDGILSNQQVFIEDKLTNTVFDLKSGNYTFSTIPGTFNDRFVLRYKNNSKTLSVEETDINNGIFALYSNNHKTLIIHNNGATSTVNSVSLFSMTGQNIGVWDVKDREQTNIQIPIKDISSGIYIVKVKTTKGESSKKIVVR
ncbi:MAG: T9SS type A sorting domain-containing protein [Flavobacterium sp.]|nr:T9SS type A sorting domain-containing protein [Flavobacterium sp.]